MMNICKMGLLLLCFGFAINPFSCKIEVLNNVDCTFYAGGATGQRAQCPKCGRYYYVGTNHQCPPKQA